MKLSQKNIVFIDNRTGSALLITMIALFVVSAATISVLMITGNALYQNHKQVSSTDAFNYAESGSEWGALYLHNAATPPQSQMNIPCEPLNDTTHTVTVTLYPATDNSGAFLKTYRIQSVATASGVTKRVDVVVKQATFGRFAYFTDKETSSVSGGAIYWKAGEVVDGPVHSNNTSGSNFNINYNGSTSPIFLDMVTAAGTSIVYTPSKPKTEAAFCKVFANGSKGYRLGVPRIELPDSTDIQKNAGWGSTGGFPSTTGVYLRSASSGGIYVVGDSKMTLGVDASGNQTIAIVQGTNTTTITIDLRNQKTTVTGPVAGGSPTSTNTIPNGVIYCTGNITSLSGQVADNQTDGNSIVKRNAMTIATDTNNGKDVTITNNLVYKTKPDKTKSASDTSNLKAGTLGIVCRNEIISSTAPKDLEIDSVCVCGGRNTTAGSFYVSNYDDKTPTGTLTVLGGIIQKARGPVGTFDSSSGVTKTGYSKNYHYDPRLADAPPPYFPTTGSYDRYSWRVVPVTKN